MVWDILLGVFIGLIVLGMVGLYIAIVWIFYIGALMKFGKK